MLSFKTLVKNQPGFVFKLIELVLSIIGTILLDVNVFADLSSFVTLVLALPGYVSITIAFILSYVIDEKPTKFLLNYFLISGIVLNLLGGIAAVCEFIPIYQLQYAADIFIVAMFAFMNSLVMFFDLLKENRKLC